MKKSLLKGLVLVFALVFLCGMVVGCADNAATTDDTTADDTTTDDTTADDTTTDDTATDDTTTDDAGSTGGYKVAFSNSYIGNAWRAHSVTAFEEYAEHLKETGMISEYYVSSSGNEPQAQINEIRNLMSQGYDAIILNSASPTALAPVCEEAVDRGIVVVAADNLVESDLVYNVGVSNFQYGFDQATWLAEQIGGEGNIIIIRGIEGTTVSIERGRGYDEVLANYPDIHVVGEIWGAWDHATVASEIGNLLDAHASDNIVGVLDEGGGEQATIEAMIDRDYDMSKVAITGGAVNGFHRISKEKNINFMGYGYPPYMTARALEIALEVLEGQDIVYDGEVIDYDGFIAITPDMVTQENVDNFILEDEPDEAFVDLVDAIPYAF